MNKGFESQALLDYWKNNPNSSGVRKKTPSMQKSELDNGMVVSDNTKSIWSNVLNPILQTPQSQQIAQTQNIPPETTPEAPKTDETNTNITGSKIGLNEITGALGAIGGLWNASNNNIRDKRRLSEVDQALNRNNVEYSQLQTQRTTDLPAELKQKQSFINSGMQGAQLAAGTQVTGQINNKGLGGGDISAPSSSALQSAMMASGAAAPYTEQLARTVVEDRLSKNQLNEQTAANNEQRGQMAYQFTDWQQRPDYLNAIENGVATATHLTNLMDSKPPELNSTDNGQANDDLNMKKKMLEYYKSIGLKLPDWASGTLSAVTQEQLDNWATNESARQGVKY